MTSTNKFCEFCGKIRSNMNFTNWNRHTSSCGKKKAKSDSTASLKKSEKPDTQPNNKISMYFRGNVTEQDTNTPKNTNVISETLVNSVSIDIDSTSSISHSLHYQESDKNSKELFDEKSKDTSETLVNSLSIDMDSTSSISHCLHYQESDKNSKELFGGKSKDISEALVNSSSIDMESTSLISHCLHYQELNKNSKELFDEKSKYISEALVNSLSIDKPLSTPSMHHSQSNGIEDFLNGSKVSEWKNDPVLLTKINRFTPEIINMIVEWGPCQPTSNNLPNSEFLKDKDGRHFHSAWYYRNQTDGTKTKRSWLSYSPLVNKLFCLDCILFGKKTAKSWVRDGYSHWKNTGISIVNHETTNAHIKASMKMKLRECVLPLIPSLEESRKTNIALNREIVKQLINITVFLGQHCLSFRGHRERWTDKLKGNFKDLVLLLSEYSPALSSHVSMLQIKGRKTNSFLSWDRQNLLIESVSQYIALTVQSDVLASKIFSVSLDSTFDISHKEQVSFIIRYVNETNGKVMERLLALKESPNTTGIHLSQLFDQVFKYHNLDWKANLVGQSYDGSANMSGHYNGLQAKIIEQNPQALFIWCSAHRLNLVVSQAVGCCLNAIDLFGNLEKIFTFISGSKKRAAFYREKQVELYPKQQLRSVKRVQTTRWLSHAYALNTVIDTYYAIYLTIEEVRNTDGKSDFKLGADCIGLLDYLTSYRFLMTAFSFKNIFDVIEPLNRTLQARDIDILAAMSLVKSAKTSILALRTDEHFKSISILIKTFEENNKKVEFQALKTTRKRKIRKMVGETCSDEVEQDPVQKFKIGTFFMVLDIIVSQINERFTNKAFEVMKDFSLLSSKRIAELKLNPNNVPKDAFKSVCMVYHTFLKLEDVCREYEQFIKSDFGINESLPSYLHPCSISNDGNDSNISSDESNTDEAIPSKTVIWKNSSSLLCVFRDFCSAGLKSIFPSLFMLLKIGVTIPVSSCSPERAFSKLKLVKSRLRSTMGDDRLEDLMRITCEADMEINSEEIIEIFA